MIGGFHEHKAGIARRSDRDRRRRWHRLGDSEPHRQRLPSAERPQQIHSLARALRKARVLDG
jgi:hypothetical protein